MNELADLLDATSLLHVAQLLPVRDVCSLQCTCRHSKDVVRSPSIWCRHIEREYGLCVEVRNYC